MTRPAFIPPMLATLVAAPFDDPDWLFEVKWDGFRVEAVIDRGKVDLWTRGEQDAARYFGAFLAPPTWLDVRDAVVDGEVIALDDHGEPDFALLQARIKGQGSAGRRRRPSCTRSSTCCTSTAGPCSTSRSRPGDVGLPKSCVPIRGSV